MNTPKDLTSLDLLPTNDIRLILLDFDGTLFDTAPGIVAATHHFSQLCGRPRLPEEMIRKSIGNGMKHLLNDLFEEDAETFRSKNPNWEAEFLEIYHQHHLDGLSYFPGVEEFLKESQMQLAILSNKPIRFIDSVMSSVALDRKRFSFVLGGDSLAQKKPHPLPFTHIMNGLGILPSQSLMVGDGEPDVLGAANAKIPCWVVKYGYLAPEKLMSLGAQRTLTSLEELLYLDRK